MCPELVTSSTPHPTRQKLSPLGTPGLLRPRRCGTFLAHTAVGDRLGLKPALRDSKASASPLSLKFPEEAQLALLLEVLPQAQPCGPGIHSSSLPTPSKSTDSRNLFEQPSCGVSLTPGSDYTGKSGCGCGCIVAVSSRGKLSLQVSRSLEVFRSVTLR